MMADSERKLGDTNKKLIVILATILMTGTFFCQTIGFFGPDWNCKYFSNESFNATDCELQGLFYPEDHLGDDILGLCLASWLGTGLIVVLSGWLLYKPCLKFIGKETGTDISTQNNPSGAETEKEQAVEKDPLVEVFDDLKARLLFVLFFVIQFLAGIAWYLCLKRFSKFGWSAIMFFWLGAAEVITLCVLIYIKLKEVFGD